MSTPTTRVGTPSAGRARDLAGLVAWLAVCFATAAFGASFPPGEWYEGLDKPFFTPPDQLFAPVWTLLYAAMAFAAWLVWRRRGWSGARGALGLFGIQLVLNGAWSWLFFGLHRPGLACGEILLLLAAIAATVRAFWSSGCRLAAGLLVPYLVWVAFAASLNASLWALNP